MNFNTWLTTFIAEKGIDPQQGITVAGPSGPNYMPVRVVLDAMRGAPAHEQRSIKAMLVRIDFANGDVLDYLRHLAQAIAI